MSVLAGKPASAGPGADAAQARRRRPFLRRAPLGDEGVSVILGAILLTGIAVGALVTVRLSFVPQWEQDAEAAHMDAIAMQLAELVTAGDRQLQNATSVRVASPVSLLNTDRATPLSPPRSPANLEFLTDAGASPVQLTSPRLLIQERNGTDLSGVDETWTPIPVSGTITDVGQVRSFRARVAQIGSGQVGDNLVISITDGNGDPAGDFTISVTNPTGPDIYVIFTVRDGVGAELYDQPESVFQGQTLSPYWVDLMDARFRFDRLVNRAVRPFTISLQENGLDADYAITYFLLGPGGGLLIGGGGSTVDAFAANFPAGRLVLRSQNTYFVDQTYVMEHGTLVLSQRDGQAFKVEPRFDARLANGILAVTLSLPELQGDPSSIAGDASASVSLRSVAQDSILAVAYELTLRVPTDYPALWTAVWARELSALGLTSLSCAPVSGTCHYAVTAGSNFAQLTVYGPEPTTTDYDLSLRLTQGAISLEVDP